MDHHHSSPRPSNRYIEWKTCYTNYKSLQSTSHAKTKQTHHAISVKTIALVWGVALVREGMNQLVCYLLWLTYFCAYRPRVGKGCPWDLGGGPAPGTVGVGWGPHGLLGGGGAAAVVGLHSLQEKMGKLGETGS